MIRRLRRKRSFTGGMTDLPLTPFIDTALVLLVIFMVSAPVINNSIKLDLPKGNMNEAKNMTQDIVISVEKDGQLSLNGKTIAINALVDKVQSALAGRQDAVVFVNGDANAAYKDIAQVVDKIKFLTGVEHVVLGTEKA